MAGQKSDLDCVPQTAGTSSSFPHIIRTFMGCGGGNIRPHECGHSVGQYTGTRRTGKGFGMVRLDANRGGTRGGS
jgi:hypothetical protein